MEQLTLEQALKDNLNKMPINNESDRQYNLGYKAGFREGAEWQRNQPNWISVKDRLPIQNSNSNTSPSVLVWSTSDAPLVTFYLHDVNKWFGIKDVTHWAYIINPEQSQDGGKTTDS